MFAKKKKLALYKKDKIVESVLIGLGILIYRLEICKI
jgi:hypothetical protein